MGVPKFFRWISERYPCLSESIKDYQVPEFDNLYLDMNGIFHVCSHPDDDNAHFRIKEEDIFKNIFHYIEVLFRKIKPQKVFFMAVDGVAPRAKLNQQRGRRFRTAKLSEDAIAKAQKGGEDLPSEAPFDSNCITPGTEFMTNLDEQLKYFITNKISTDALWQSCTVIYSGHKTPGEGEHKIMDYIRYCRSQDNYDPNTRHCLYGLDADLIMLGLTSHEPHFSLLREEIIYGKKTRRIQTPEEINFYLFHLSLMREYINLEFAALHKIHFGYDIECVIDDVVLLGFLVGNDFIPNLPELHINKEGLTLLFDTYKKCLPTLDGYINEKGTLNLKRFEVFMKFLSEVEIEKFRDINDDLKYLANKRKENSNGGPEGLQMMLDDDSSDMFCSELESISSEHVKNTFAKLGLEEPEDFSDPEDTSLSEEEQIFRSEFRQYKHNYYRSKFNCETINYSLLKDLACHYVRGIQWILNYYFNGICSWSWFYPFHYSPYTSDVANFSDVEILFDMSTAFLPYQQLLAVLPPYSVKLVPNAFRHLMLRENSPLSGFYPKNFETDLNGKIQEWEAVVLIPFIDEDRLIKAMEPCNSNLLPEEMERNKHGNQFLYMYTSDNLGIYRAPNYFSSVVTNHAGRREEPKNAWYLTQREVFKGLHPDVDLNVHYSGFPTLYHLDYSFRISREVVKVFQQGSRNDSIILQVSTNKPLILDDLAQKFMDKIIYVSWPHLVEAKVVAISDGKRKYQLIDDELTGIDMSSMETAFWRTEIKDISQKILNRWGIDAGSSEILVHCKTICGLKYSCTREGKITLEKLWCQLPSTFLWQLVVTDIEAYKPSYKKYNNVEELFSIGTKVFMMGKPYYGSMGTVMSIIPEGGRVRVEMITHEEPNLSEARDNFHRVQNSYLTADDAAVHLGMTSSLFARITGTILVSPAARLQPFQRDQKFINKTNIGMNLKNNVRGEEVKGYTRKEGNLWLYSQLCIEAVHDYYNHFPEVLLYINSNIYDKSAIYQDELFEKEWQENFKKLKAFLEEAAFTKAERKKSSSVELDLSSIVLVETQVVKYSHIDAKAKFMHISPHLLFLPNSLQGSSPPDSNVTFEILDRVVNVREGYCVPLGARGTIIGIHPSKKEIETLYDVMFDEAFIGGSALLGSISAGRCCRMYWSAIINLSHGMRKSGREPPPPAIQSASMSKSIYYGNSQNNPVKSFRNMSGFELRTYNGNARKEPRRLQPLPIIATRSEEAKPIQSSDGMKGNEAPAPSSLPSPFQFALKSIQKVLPKKNPDVVTSPRREYKRTDNNNQRSQLIDVTKMAFLLHGTQYSNWKSIKYGGLGNGNEYINCVNYIPNYFQLLIYLDVPMLLKDGYKFIEYVENEILCSTNQDRKIPLKYIEKAYDTRNDQLIYISPNCRDANLNLPDVNRVLKGKGRGQAIKEFIEEEAKNDPITLGRRIRESMQSLNSISKERCVLPGMKQLEDIGKEYPAENTNPGGQFDGFGIEYPASNDNPKEQFEDYVPEKIFDPNAMDLSEAHFPNLPTLAVLTPVEKFKPKSPKKTHDSTVGNESTTCPRLEHVFVPTQVSRSSTSIKPIPERRDSPGPEEPSNVKSSCYSSVVKVAKKDKSPSSAKTKVVVPRAKRCRLVANFDDAINNS